MGQRGRGTYAPWKDFERALTLEESKSLQIKDLEHDMVPLQDYAELMASQGKLPAPEELDVDAAAMEEVLLIDAMLRREDIRQREQVGGAESSVGN